MTTMHPARKRLLLGILLIAATFFYTFAPTCGLIGQFVHYVTSRLLGQTGSTLLSLTMLVVGILFVLPHDALGRFFRWAFHGREARVAKVVRESDEWMRAAEVRRIVAEAIQAHLTEKPAVQPAASVRDRRALDDVRTALKGLGYTKSEFEPLVVKMDPTLAPEILIRSAIKELYADSGKN
jgi:hypothetical protein